jgi:hypothetical protein
LASASPSSASKPRPSPRFFVMMISELAGLSGLQLG